MLSNKDRTEIEIILSRMTVLERQIMDRAGQWILRNGHMWDEGLHAYVSHCANCRHLYLHQRADKKTCSEKCKKARLRKTSKANFAKVGKKGQMRLHA
jgi:hypothetical protein